MYAQFQIDNIHKYNYDVLDFIKFVKKLYLKMSIIIHAQYICLVIAYGIYAIAINLIYLNLII